MPSTKKGKAGGLALAAAAVGVAVKNRDRLPGMRSREQGAPDSTTNASTPPTPPGV